VHSNVIAALIGMPGATDLRLHGEHRLGKIGHRLHADEVDPFSSESPQLPPERLNHRVRIGVAVRSEEPPARTARRGHVRPVADRAPDSGHPPGVHVLRAVGEPVALKLQR
jgi:hypothetical protein